MMPIGPLMIEHRLIERMIEVMKRQLRLWEGGRKKEDRHFFLPIMEYFSKEEKDAMLDEEYEFDRVLIHEIYLDKVTKDEEYVFSVHKGGTHESKG